MPERKTIWLLADSSRTVRPAQCLGYTEREIGYQKSYIAASYPPIPAEVLSLIEEHRDAEAIPMLNTLIKYDTNARWVCRTVSGSTRSPTSPSTSAGPLRTP